MSLSTQFMPSLIYGHVAVGRKSGRYPVNDPPSTHLQVHDESQPTRGVGQPEAVPLLPWQPLP